MIWFLSNLPLGLPYLPRHILHFENHFEKRNMRREIRESIYTPIDVGQLFRLCSDLPRTYRTSPFHAGVMCSAGHSNVLLNSEIRRDRCTRRNSLCSFTERLSPEILLQEAVNAVRHPFLISYRHGDSLSAA